MDDKIGSGVQFRNDWMKEREEARLASVKTECEMMVVIHASGLGIDHDLTAKLRATFAFKDTEKTIVDWDETKRTRLLCLEGMEISRQKKPQPAKPEEFRVIPSANGWVFDFHKK
jgi:hypothetical protein